MHARTSRNLSLLALFLWGGVGLAALGAEPLPGLKLNPDGSLRLGAIRGGVIHFAPGWQCATQYTEGSVVPEAGFPAAQDNGWRWQGVLKTKNLHELKLVESWTAAGANSTALSLTAQSDPATPTQCLGFSLDLPVDNFAGVSLRADAKEIVLPVEPGKTQIESFGGVKELVLPVGDRNLVLRGNLSGIVQDNREYGATNYELRLFFSKFEGEIAASEFKAEWELRPFNITSLSLKPVANMGFRDETEGDRQGGWTDQGVNDLRMFKPGRQALGPVQFDIVDPAANAGKAVLSLAGPSREYFPASASLPVADVKGENLYLLHALAWAPSQPTVIGKIGVTYADGSQDELEVRSGREVGDWWAPGSLDNGAVVWTGENAASYVGLYLSRFKLKPQPVQSLEFKSEQKAVWLIVGAAAGERAALPRQAPVYIVANKDWQPLKAELTVEKGGALDFSFLSEGFAPAGKDGWVKLNNGRFEFENRPGAPIRFWGANLCFTAMFQDKAATDRMVEDLVRLGYNTVRFHHYDGILTAGKTGSSLDFDAEQLDKLDYLFYRCKEKGLYITIDLYTIRRPRPGEIPEIKREVYHDYKALVPLLDSAWQNLAKYSQQLLDHVNPYTKVAWKDDPALFFIDILNEDGPTFSYKMEPDVQAMYEERFAAWLKEQGLEPADDAARAAAFNRFATDLHAKMYDRTVAFLRQIGVKALLLDMNWQNFVSTAEIRDRMDFSDNHNYWDHPRFLEKKWNLPFGYGNQSATAKNAAVPLGMAAPRTVGRPYGVTEFNYCMPNRYRSEGGPLMGAYSSFQDWDAIYRFAYAHHFRNTQEVVAASGFDIATDPLTLLSERLALLLFLRRDVRPGEKLVPFAVSEAATNRQGAYSWGLGDYPADYRRVAMTHRIGSFFVGPGKTVTPAEGFAVGLPDFPSERLGGAAYIPADEKLIDALQARGLATLELNNPETKIYKSDTGELELNAAAGTFKAITPRTECFVLPAGQVGEGQFAQVADVDQFATVSVSSLTPEPLGASPRLLVLHLTDVQNTKIKYKNKDLTALEKWGELPHLARRGAATLRLKLAGEPKVWALDMAGRRVDQIAARRDGDWLVLPLSTVGEKGVQFAYEIEK